MNKKTNELKNALQSLRVNEALRLSKGAATKDFAFKPPESSEINSSPDQNKLRSVYSEMKASTDENNPSSSQSQPKVLSAPIDPSAGRSEMPKRRAKNNLGSNQAEMGSRAEKSTDDGFDITLFVTDPRKIELFERGEGTFHIPHKIYELVHKVIDTKVELLVFNCLLRYTLGFQRATCQASQSFISRWTGIAVPNVRKALKSLIGRGFVRRLEQGTIVHDSAVYELPIVKAYLAYERSRKLGAAFTKSEIKRRSDSNDPRSDQSIISDQNNPTSEIDSSSKKERENKSKNKTLSQKLPAAVEKYFATLAPRQKREREWKAFESLKSQFTLDQIATSLEFVQQNGALEDKAPVHSPMAYLALSISDVIRQVNAQREAQQRMAEAERINERERHERQQAERREAQEFKKKEVAFCNIFREVEQQQAMIQEICNRQQFAWEPRGQIARNIAIEAWWNELSPQERQSSEDI